VPIVTRFGTLVRSDIVVVETSILSAFKALKLAVKIVSKSDTLVVPVIVVRVEPSRVSGSVELRRRSVPRVERIAIKAVIKNLYIMFLLH